MRRLVARWRLRRIVRRLNRACTSITLAASANTAAQLDEFTKFLTKLPAALEADTKKMTNPHD